MSTALVAAVERAGVPSGGRGEASRSRASCSSPGGASAATGWHCERRRRRRCSIWSRCSPTSSPPSIRTTPRRGAPTSRRRRSTGSTTGSFRPHVYGAARASATRAPSAWSTRRTRTRSVYLALFVQGYPLRAPRACSRPSGTCSASKNGRSRRTALFLLGTDRLGRDSGRG